jgi:hypothetical protein
VARRARHQPTDPRLESSYIWSKREMIAEDYRLLFGTAAAQEVAQMNYAIPDARDVPGLKDLFTGTWAKP